VALLNTTAVAVNLSQLRAHCRHRQADHAFRANNRAALPARMADFWARCGRWRRTHGPPDAAAPEDDRVPVSPGLRAAWRRSAWVPRWTVSLAGYSRSAQLHPWISAHSFDTSPDRSSWPPDATTARFSSRGSACFGETAMGVERTFKPEDEPWIFDQWRTTFRNPQRQIFAFFDFVSRELGANPWPAQPEDPVCCEEHSVVTQERVVGARRAAHRIIWRVPYLALGRMVVSVRRIVYSHCRSHCR
jgi:hypothetical protein